jgi:hypothetical protein
MYSSLIFLTNVASTLYKNYYIYSFSFLGLTITSLIFHSNNTIYTNLIDKLFIGAVVAGGSVMLYHKTYNPIHVVFIVITFLSCIFLFFYGYCVNNYCYHPDKHVGDTYHCILHIITSIGHHMITLL